MTALVRMRLAAFVRSGRALAPVIAALVVLAVIHGGGASAAAPAFGYSAVMLFPVLAWTAKLVLDAEPDVQRRIARLTVGPRRELVAGVLAATVIGLTFCVVAMLAPWPFGAIRGPAPGTAEPALATGVALGVLAHLLALPAAVALGALASRAVTRSVRNGVTVLATGAVLAVVLGLSGSVAPWLAPPLMATARALNEPSPPPAPVYWQLAAWAAAWAAVALAGYARLRRRRA
jgi:MYXO-CTERM domain-containing protein